MHKFLLSALAAGFLLASPVFAQSSNKVEKAKYFLEVEQMPDATRFLPDFPAFGSAAFKVDSLIYEEGKRLRGTERGQMAVEDANTSIRFILRRFSPAMERELTPERYPALAEFVFNTYATARRSITKAKDVYKRRRPYQYFNEPSAVPEREDKNDFTSYPSGHTIRFWTAALTLASLDPEHQDAILKTGYDMGQSRTIVGYHYQSDVDAARLAASAAFARLSADPAWRKAFKKAQKELRKN